MVYLLDPGCYRIYCTKTRMQYIGSSKVAVKGRLSDHRKKLRKAAVRCNREMLHDFLRYGERTFKFEVILRCAATAVVFEEQRLLDTAVRLYNGSRTASHRGPKKLCDEVRQKMSHSAKNRCDAAFRKAASLRAKLMHAECRHVISEVGRRKLSEALRNRHAEGRMPNSRNKGI